MNQTIFYSHVSLFPLDMFCIHVQAYLSEMRLIVLFDEWKS